MKSHNKSGYSLVEFLITVGIVGIIAAIAIPNLLSSRREANEVSAQSSLRTIHVAQATYQATHGTFAFARTLAELQSAGLIDKALGSGSKNGYIFAIVEQGGFGENAVFGAYAFPAQSGMFTPGSLRFGIKEDGIIRGDADLTIIPLTRSRIDSMPPLDY